MDKNEELQSYKVGGRIMAPRPKQSTTKSRRPTDGNRDAVVRLITPRLPLLGHCGSFGYIVEMSAFR